MSATATPSPREAEARAVPERTLNDRVVAVLPLASVYVWLCIVFLVEAWNRVTPWLFTDELELTQLSRSIAATGHAARRGEAHSFDSLYTVMTAPIWLIHDVAQAYSGVKYLDVFVMAAVVFPTYFLARMVVGRKLVALRGRRRRRDPVARVLVVHRRGDARVPVCRALLLADREGARRWPPRTSGRGAGRSRRSSPASIAPSVRGELVVIPIALAFAIFFAVWSSEWARQRRAYWSYADWLGVIALGFGAVFVISGIATHHSQEWYGVTTYWKHRIIVLGDWAAGSLAIGLGVIPLVAGLTSLVRAPGEETTRELRMFRCVALAGVISVGMYTGMKAAYLSTVFATRVEERNLIYIAPLLLIGTAIVLERRRVNWYALAAATAYAFYLVVGTPFQMGVQLYSDALGLSILQQANRYLYWTPTTGQWVLIAVLAGGVVAIVALALLRGRRTARRRDRSRARGRDRRLEPHRRDRRRRRHELDQPHPGRDAPAPVHVGRRHHEAAADDLPRRRGVRPEPRVDARVLEPLDRHRQQLRRHRRRSRAGRRAEPHRERLALLDARSRESRAPVRVRRRGLSVHRLRRHVSAAGTSTAPAAGRRCGTSSS